MLVIVSDIHLTDGTSGVTIHSGAFKKFALYLKDLAETASRGRPTDEQFNFYRGFIEGGIGLVITGYAGISRAGKSALFHMNMIDSDELIPYHKKLVDRVHEA